MAEPLNVPIATIPKNSRQEVRVSLSEFKGAQFLDVRIYADFGEAESRGATKQGVTISLERLREFVRAVADAETMAARLGLIGGVS